MEKIILGVPCQHLISHSSLLFLFRGLWNSDHVDFNQGTFFPGCLTSQTSGVWEGAPDWIRVIISIKKWTVGVPWWLSRWRIWHCHCCIAGLIPGLGTPAYCRCSQKERKEGKRKKKDGRKERKKKKKKERKEGTVPAAEVVVQGRVPVWESGAIFLVLSPLLTPQRPSLPFGFHFLILIMELDVQIPTSSNFLS